MLRVTRPFDDAQGRPEPVEGRAESRGDWAADLRARPTDLWIPYVIPPNQQGRGRSFGPFLHVLARLKPGVSLAQAQAQMDQVAAAIEQANPDTVTDNRIGVRPLHDHLIGASTRSWMLMLLGAVGIVLVIACANVANLLLARASAREREVAVRAALGAGRWRLVRQLIVESLVLSAAGTAMSISFAWWAVDVLRSAMPDGVPRVASIALDLRVLGATAGLSLVTGLLFGIVPALQLSKPDLTHSLKDGGQGASAGRRRQRVRSVLVVAEVALAVVLLVGASLFIGSFIALMGVDPGFDPAHVLTADVSPRSEPGAELVSGQTAQRRLNMLMLGLFGLLGLVISAAGIYGVLACAISQRIREIGVRMALGATRSAIVRMVAMNACVLVSTGLVAGGVGAWYLSRTAKAFLFGLEADDPRAFASALAALVLAAAVASILPARRAASVDPIVALRAE